MSAEPIPTASVAPPVWYKSLPQAILIGGVVVLCLASCVVGMVGTLIATSLAHVNTHPGESKQAGVASGQADIVGKWEPANADDFVKDIEFRKNKTTTIDFHKHSAQKKIDFKWDVEGKQDPKIVFIFESGGREAREYYRYRIEDSILFLTPLTDNKQRHIPPCYHLVK